MVYGIIFFSLAIVLNWVCIVGTGLSSDAKNILGVLTAIELVALLVLCLLAR